MGKTLSTRHYAQCNLIKAYFPECFYDSYRLTSIERVIAQIERIVQIIFENLCIKDNST